MRSISVPNKLAEFICSGVKALWPACLKSTKYYSEYIKSHRINTGFSSLRTSAKQTTVLLGNSLQTTSTTRKESMTGLIEGFVKFCFLHRIQGSTLCWTVSYP